MMNNMAAWGSQLVLSCVLLCVLASSSATTWPVPYRRFSSRPPTNPYCKAGVQAFCPTGREANTMPTFHPADMIEVYALKAPVWEFKFGDLMARYHIMHDAVGFKNVNTGKNYTMEWYELFQLFNCTFAHVLTNDTLKWCNQGATCIYDGIDDIHWSQNGTLVKVADITGDMFNDFAKWTLWDNKTGIYYETWTVEHSPGGELWFDAFDCASWVLRAFQKLSDIGAEFNTSVLLNYTRIHLYCDEPKYLGNASDIFGPGRNETLVKDMLKFYDHFQSHQSIGHLIESLIDAYIEVYWTHRFYFFYNFEYWFLPMVEPYIKLTYSIIPLPGSPDYKRIHLE